jgi:hypothetical protein
MDALYVPYTTDPESASNLPHWEEPEGGPDVELPVATQLKPFGRNTASAGAITPDTGGGDLPVDLSDYADEFKGVTLRSPLVLAGWGFDTNGDPVPGEMVDGVSGPEIQFVQGYKTRADLWKAGPVDLKWDDNRKLWTSKPDSPWYLGEVKTDIDPRGSGLAIRQQKGSFGLWEDAGHEDSIHNPHDIVLPSGLRVRYTSKYTGWNDLVAEPFHYTECSGTT